LRLGFAIISAAIARIGANVGGRRDCEGKGFHFTWFSWVRFSEERDSLREKIGQGKEYFQIFEEKSNKLACQVFL
jgi:hypothetical protein